MAHLELPQQVQFKCMDGPFSLNPSRRALQIVELLPNDPAAQIDIAVKILNFVSQQKVSVVRVLQQRLVVCWISVS
jgi:hypothetical protein